MLIANDTAMQIASQCFRLCCSPLATPGTCLCSLHQEKEAVLPEVPGWPSQPTDSWAAEISHWATGTEKIPRNLILGYCRAWVPSFSWGESRIIIGEGVYLCFYFCLSTPLLLPLRRLRRWCCVCSFPCIARMKNLLFQECGQISAPV